MKMPDKSEIAKGRLLFHRSEVLAWWVANCDGTTDELRPLADRIIKFMGESHRLFNSHLKDVAHRLPYFGLIRPLSLCQMCGGRGYRIVAHHINLRRPLDVYWLCDECHREAHGGLPGDADENLLRPGCEREAGSYDAIRRFPLLDALWRIYDEGEDERIDRQVFIMDDLMDDLHRRPQGRKASGS